VIAVFFSLVNVLRGVHRIYWKKARPQEALELAVSTGIAVLFLWLANRFFVTRPPVPGGLFLFAGLLAMAGFVAVRYRERILTGIAAPWLNLRKGGSVVGEKVLIVGAGKQSELARWLVRKGDLAQAFNIVGMVDDDPRKQGLRIEGVRMLGTTQDIPDLVARHDIGLILFAISNIKPQEKQRIIRACEALNISLVMLPKMVRMMREYFHFDWEAAGSSPPEDESIDPAQLVGWLDQIERYITDGDLDAAHALINRIRQEKLGYEPVPEEIIQVHT
jgi:FlaA1/EpsC-like NDP-sugar epimerase